MKRKSIIYLFVMLIVSISITACTGNSIETPLDVAKAEKLLPVDTPYREMILAEVEKGYITSEDIEVNQFMERRFDYYISMDGNYNIEKHDPLVTAEAMKEFNLTKDEVDTKNFRVVGLMVGEKPEEIVQLSNEAKPVEITIDKVDLSPDNKLVVTATNNTDSASALPTINMTFNLYKGGQGIGFQVVWAENFQKGTQEFESLPLSEDIDSVSCIAYINIDKLNEQGLKSKVQVSNDYGESIIPVYELPMTEVR